MTNLPNKFIAFSQAQVYNELSADTFTQDWRVRLERATLLNSALERAEELGLGPISEAAGDILDTVTITDENKDAHKPRSHYQEKGERLISRRFSLSFSHCSLVSLVFTMGYLSLRHQKTQGALKLGVDKLIIDRDEGIMLLHLHLHRRSISTFTDPSDNATIQLNDQVLQFTSQALMRAQSTP